MSQLAKYCHIFKQLSLAYTCLSKKSYVRSEHYRNSKEEVGGGGERGEGEKGGGGERGG